MPRNAMTTIMTYGILVIAGAVSFSLPPSLSIPAVVAEPVDYSVIRLAGVVRDFKPSHPDFEMTNSARMGHQALNVETTLGENNQPVFTGDGYKVLKQWHDKHGNPIAPYGVVANDPGLPGGHFDVDVFDEPSTKEKYHEHEYDDKFDVTYVDIVNDSKLQFDKIIGNNYPNDLRLVFRNAHHGSGTYTFQVGGAAQTGNTSDGFETTFDPNKLKQLRVTFTSLNDLRGTKPDVVQGDMTDRDDSLSIRMYDADSGTLVYELAVYHHIKKDKDKDKDNHKQKQKHKHNKGKGKKGNDHDCEKADLDDDGDVDADDLQIITDHLGKTCASHDKDHKHKNKHEDKKGKEPCEMEKQTCLADVVSDGIVNILDSSFITSHIGCAADGNVDEEDDEDKIDHGYIAKKDACGKSINDSLGTFGAAANGAVTDADSFGQWFHDTLGTNLSTMHMIELHRNTHGVYEYMTDEFYPVDGKMFGNGRDTHNNYFTYSISAVFTYNACQDQFFEFEGNDDSWVFIDDKLAIDLGGAATPTRQYVAMDRLHLEDGQEYKLNFFYAQRRSSIDSIFHMRTNLFLTNDTTTAVTPMVTSAFD